MTWNYRIVQKIERDGETSQGIYEVYYDDAGCPQYVTENPVQIQWTLGENFIYIRNQIMQAFEQPVLYYEDFEQADKEVF